MPRVVLSDDGPVQDTLGITMTPTRLIGTWQDWRQLQKHGYTNQANREWALILSQCLQQSGTILTCLLELGSLIQWVLAMFGSVPDTQRREG